MSAPAAERAPRRWSSGAWLTDMETGFSVTVTDISMREYLCAVRRVCARRDLTALVLVPAAFLIFIWNLRGFSALTIILPIVLLAVMAAWFEITRVISYSKFPADIKMVYCFDEQGWSLRVKEETASIPWGETTRLVERKHLFLLCQGKNVSNLLPKRCLSEEQCARIRAWFQAVR